MTAKLKNLAITSTDLVDKGANPDAHIRLFKRDVEEDSHGGGIPDSPPETSQENTVRKSEQTAKVQAVADFFTDFFKGFFSGEEGSTSTLLQEMEVNKVVDVEVEVEVLEKGINKEEETVEINLKNMSQEDRETLGHLAKKYDMGEISSEITEEKEVQRLKHETGGTPTAPTSPTVPQDSPETVEKMATLETELKVMKRALKLKELEDSAVKYEVLGKRKEELAVELYKMNEAGESILKAFTEALDGQLDLLEKRSLFHEIGSSASGSVGSTYELDEKALEIAKRDQISMAKATVLAYEEYPELALAYEKEFKEG